MFNCGQLNCNWKLSKNDKTLHQGLKTPYCLTTYGLIVGPLAGDYTMGKGTADNVIGVVMFLASPSSSFITGQSIAYCGDEVML